MIVYQDINHCLLSCRSSLLDVIYLLLAVLSLFSDGIFELCNGADSCELALIDSHFFSIPKKLSNFFQWHSFSVGKGNPYDGPHYAGKHNEYQVIFPLDLSEK
jgi:hypothetical protein